MAAVQLQSPAVTSTMHQQNNENITSPNEVRQRIYLEDRSHYGSFITLSLKPDILFREIKQLVWTRWKMPVVIQRFMVDQEIVKDEQTLKDFNLPDDTKKLYLYFLSPRSVFQTQQKFQEKLHPAPVRRKVCNSVPGVQKPKMAAAVKPVKAQKYPPVKPQLTWKCPVCTFDNAPMRPGCEMCSAARPDDFVIPEDYEPTNAEMEIMDKEDQAIRVFQKSVAGEKQEAAKSFQVLQQAYKKNLTFTDKPIHCSICMTEYPAGEAIVLQNCLHAFCRECIIGHIQHSEEAVIKCPYQDDYACNMDIAEYEIKAIASGEIYQKHLKRGLQIAENKDPNSFHCKTPDCPGWCTFEDEVNMFKCPVCMKKNCLTCAAIHEGMNCRDYQKDLQRRALNDTQAQATQTAVQRMLDQGDAMKCPGCGIILQKKEGCDWLRCTMCKMEICWVTKGPRWGPKGKGDTSGGCKCGVGGKGCHPACRYCH